MMMSGVWNRREADSVRNIPSTCGLCRAIPPTRLARSVSAKFPGVMVRWRGTGEERLATVDVRQFGGDTIVVHFGGQLTSVDAYTFANSLVAFADTVRGVNAQINPGQNIEVRLEAVGPGSFKAVIKYVKKGLIGLFASAPQNIF